MIILPWNAALPWVLFFSELFQSSDAFRLDLKEGFVGREAKVIHAFGKWYTQACPLTSSQQKNRHFILWYTAQACVEWWEFRSL